MKQVYYKQNEKFEYEFFKDKEYTQEFEFNGEDKNFYLELKEGNISPITALNIFKDEKSFTGIENVFIPYIPECQLPAPRIIKTLKDITPNYSKYIPNDCAVVFLNKWEYVNNFQKYKNILKECPIYIKDHSNPELCKNKDCACQDGWDIYPMHNTTSSQLPKKVILFTPELTSANIKQINDTAKVLKEKYGVEWVGVFTELCFISLYCCSGVFLKYCVDSGGGEPVLSFINVLITTNATEGFEPLESEHLKVIDCKEIFEEYIKTNE